MSHIESNPVIKAKQSISQTPRRFNSQSSQQQLASQPTEVCSSFNQSSAKKAQLDQLLQTPTTKQVVESHTGPLSFSISQVPLREHSATDFIPEATNVIPGTFLTKFTALKSP